MLLPWRQPRKTRPQARLRQCPILKAWIDVEVIQQQGAAFRLDDDKAGALAADQDLPRMLRRKSRQEALARPDRIEPAEALEAFAHGKHAKRGQRLCVIRIHSAQRDRVRRHVGQ